MSKRLNGLKKTPLIGIRRPPPARSNTYEPSTPRVTLGLASVAMTVVTIAVLVILPGQMGSGSHEPPMVTASKATSPASIDLAAVTTIEVVSAREPRPSTVPMRIGEAEPQPGPPGKTAFPIVVRVSTTTGGPVD
jgi:hypothetical protein